MSSVILIALTVLTLQLDNVSSKICYNVDVRNHVKNFEIQLNNCTVIAGYLRILLIENNNYTDYDGISFPKLREIKGYLMVYHVKGLTTLGKLFPNLKYIRGINLFMDYAFIIFDCRDLVEIGLANLRHIQRGSTRIGKCPKLCYVNTIDWNKIGSSYHELIFEDRRRGCNDTCSHECSEGCWNNETCQIFLKTEKCHNQCIGCIGPKDTQCALCKRYNKGKKCVASCPKDTVIHSELKTCIPKVECNTTLPELWKIEDRVCVKNTLSKMCNGTEIVNMEEVKNMFGCTIINGSLSIQVNAKNSIFELREYMENIEDIWGYLKIYRSSHIKNLKFLKNLKVIRGKELYNNRYALVMFENKDLHQLWDLEETSLKIKNGTILFHYNPQLCNTEINALAHITNVSYDEYDVSLYSNGDKKTCSYIDLNVTAEANAVNATLKWNKFEVGNNTGNSTSNNTFTIGYLISYTQDPLGILSTDDESNTCEGSSWKSVFVFNNDTYTLVKLNSYTQYSYYLKVYMPSLLQGGQTKIKRFMTKMGDPDVDDDVNVTSYSSTSLILSWNPPVFSNGIVAFYNLLMYNEEDVESFIYQRNYCDFPHRFIQSNWLDDKNESKPYIINEDKDCCKISKSETTLSFKCDNLFTFNSCKTYMHSSENSTSSNVILESLSQTMDPNMKWKEMKIEAQNVTSFEVKNLKPFTLYVFLLTYCNSPSQCSSPIMGVGRTLSNFFNDALSKGPFIRVVNNDSIITWKDPVNPNGPIVSYNIEYVRNDIQNPDSTIVCLTKQLFTAMNHKYNISNLHLGEYAVRVRAISFAGPGPYSKFVEFTINPVPHAMSIELTIIVTVVFIMLIVGGIFYYRYNNQPSYSEESDELQLIPNLSCDYSGTSYIDDKWEIERDDIETLYEMVKGECGVVYSGFIISEKIPCAVKVINDKASEYDITLFLNEASAMKNLSNCNHVVKLLGIVSKEQPMIVTELMSRGDLKNYLRKSRSFINNIKYTDMFRMAAEIADGMMYLSSEKFIHRDLAARNCMVSSDGTIKIGDFGMSKDVYIKDYYKIGSNDFMPIRWMSPESLADGIFTAHSDIWSYGVLVWEIVTLAEQPYYEFSNEQVLQFVISQGILKRPCSCPDLLFEIMCACWKWKPYHRPRFYDIVAKLEKFIGEQFGLVSFYHSSQGGEFMRNDKNRSFNIPAFVTPLSVNSAVYWSTSSDSVNM